MSAHVRDDAFDLEALAGLSLGDLPFNAYFASLDIVEGFDRGGIALFPGRITGTLDVTAALPEFTAIGAVVLRGSLVVAPASAPRCYGQASGLVLVRATAHPEAGRTICRAIGAVANPGDWVLVIDDDAEDVVIVTSQ